ncbi:HNH endonuclease family protein [Mycobacterium paragordonae]|uniref:HNH endonuclease family protein n=1 Tax=Mycobacterium paragordonae TaxID=1389713 RepID=A0AAJ1SD25_9MYCO|nr:HNH endonuclease family protein [Mycobacterium paragordonae]MDP7739304.1 HNH endonuclease family protein [Mycobacterium paragordonae]TDK94632.1 HNH endonuclease [Mycobacterium paragordonae]TDL04077.1 HNH endonuclease [Mycobacterium paragordonae]
MRHSAVRRPSAKYRIPAIAAAAATVAALLTIGIRPDPAVTAGSTSTATHTELSEVLAKVTVVDVIAPLPGYQRGCGVDKKTGVREACVFGPAWNDPLDHSGCDTRNRLIRLSLRDIEYKPGTRGCKVTAGRLDPDPYTGQTIDLAHVAVDHVIPLKVAWNAGAAHWDLRLRRIFANDLTELIAVSSSANSRKGDSTLSEWIPETGKCRYVIRFLTVAAKYHLPITVKDRSAATAACLNT